MLFIRLLLFLLIFTAFSSSCRKERFTDDPAADLSFSTDTLHFDTVFVTVGSATRNFKVRNENSNAVRISHIRLAGGEKSPFRINVDGRAGTHITEYELSGEDSMYIFVEVTIDPNASNLPFIILDSILFETNGNQQKIILAAYGQNAHFFRDSVICDQTWTNDKPYVIYGYVGVAGGCKLTIEEGVKIYSHRGSGILAAGTIDVNGTKENPVIFQGDRLEQTYAKEPGQWYGIRFLPKSMGNIISHAIIQNGVIGIEVDSLPTSSGYNLTLEKTIIRRMSLADLVGYTSHINAKNLLMYTCGQSIFVGALGGKYNFTNCTFDNSQSIVTKRDPSIWLTNTNYEDKERGINLQNDLTAVFRNSIIWGNLEDEIELVQDGKGAFNTLFEWNIIKATEVKFDQSQNKINEYPRFVNPSGEDYSLDHNSPATNYGKYFPPPYDVPDDIKNDLRDNEPDAGAYERK